MYWVTYYHLLCGVWGGIGLSCWSCNFFMYWVTYYHLLCGVRGGIGLSCWSCKKNVCTGLHITTCCVVFRVGKILLVGVVICFVYCLAYYNLLYDFWGGVSLTCWSCDFSICLV